MKIHPCSDLGYHHDGRRVAFSQRAALAYAWAVLVDRPDAIVVLKDGSGELALEACKRGRWQVPYYRRWRGESWTGWVRIPQVSVRMAPDDPDEWTI